MALCAASPVAFPEDAPQVRLSGNLPGDGTHNGARSRTSACRAFRDRSEGRAAAGSAAPITRHAPPFVMLGRGPSIHRAAREMASCNARRSRPDGSSGQARGRQGGRRAQHPSPDTPQCRQTRSPSHHAIPLPFQSAIPLPFCAPSPSLRSRKTRQRRGCPGSCPLVRPATAQDPGQALCAFRERKRGRGQHPSPDTPQRPGDEKRGSGASRPGSII